MIIKNIDPNYFNSRLQGYATHNAQIDYPEGYHLVSDASMNKLMPHPGYHNPYSYNAQQLQQSQVQGQWSLAQGQQVQVQGSQAQTQGQPRQEVAGMDAEFVNRITAMM